MTMILNNNYLVKLCTKSEGVKIEKNPVHMVCKHAHNIPTLTNVVIWVVPPLSVNDNVVYEWPLR